MFRIDDLNRFTHKDNKKVEIELLLMSIEISIQQE